ncbi:hypothetical protein GCM10010347_19520 [Streptomyces cirratus]|uniref:Uncharacterized protein n=1 Tax=Streptomyces cirratus TaxID=68187 RepID=A0ABQ3EW61_9ACTN|nr:hypothetical protein GCM10010347_19520 [Streptomyces cirratus]
MAIGGALPTAASGPKITRPGADGRAAPGKGRGTTGEGDATQASATSAPGHVRGIRTWGNADRYRAWGIGSHLKVGREGIGIPERLRQSSGAGSAPRYDIL